MYVPSMAIKPLKILQCPWYWKTDIQLDILSFKGNWNGKDVYFCDLWRVHTDTDTNTDTDGNGLQTHFVGVGVSVGVGRCEHSIRRTNDVKDTSNISSYAKQFITQLSQVVFQGNTYLRYLLIVYCL